MNTIFICPNCQSIPFIEAISIDSQKEYIYRLTCKCGRQDISLSSLPTKTQKEIARQIYYCYNTRHKTQKVSSLFCGVCGKWYCKKCSSIHQDDLHHNFFPCEVNTTLFCYKHPNEEAHYLCKSCEMILCKKCACEANHKNHQSNSIRDNKKTIKKDEPENEKNKWEKIINESTYCYNDCIKVIDQIIEELQEFKKIIIEKYNKFIKDYKAQSFISHNIKNNTYLLSTNYINANNYSKIEKISINNLNDYIDVKQLYTIKEEIESRITSLDNLNPFSFDKTKETIPLSAIDKNVIKQKLLLDNSNLSFDSKKESQVDISIVNSQSLGQYRTDPF